MGGTPRDCWLLGSGSRWQGLEGGKETKVTARMHVHVLLEVIRDKGRGEGKGEGKEGEGRERGR